MHQPTTPTLKDIHDCLAAPWRLYSPDWYRRALKSLLPGEIKGYAVVQSDGRFVGIWHDKELAELVASKGNGTYKVVPMYELSEFRKGGPPDTGCQAAQGGEV